ncbi:MAG: ABC transporter substrate-binding protein [Desulfovibrionales bacterium]
MKHVLLLLALLLLFQCPARAEAPAGDEEIVLGMSAPFSGPSRALGIELYRGATAYFNHVNRNGGINGRTIRIQAYDDGYNPDPTVSNTIQLIERDRVLLLFQYFGTPTVTRILPVLKRYSDQNFVLLFPFSGAELLRTPPYSDQVFNLRGSYGQETKGLVDNFVRAGRKRIAVFYQVDAYGRSGVVGVRQALHDHGLNIVAEATYRRGAGVSDSMERQVEILARSRPDAIITIGAYAACSAFIRDARLNGLDSIPIASLSFAGKERQAELLAQESARQNKDLTQNLVFSHVFPFYGDQHLPAGREYHTVMTTSPVVLPANFDLKDYAPRQFSATSFEGFLNAKLLVHALRKVPPPITRTKVRDALESIKRFDLGINSNIEFGRDDHQGMDRIFYSTLKHGKIVPLNDWSVWAR